VEPSKLVLYGGPGPRGKGHFWGDGSRMYTDKILNSARFKAWAASADQFHEVIEIKFNVDEDRVSRVAAWSNAFIIVAGDQ